MNKSFNKLLSLANVDFALFILRLGVSALMLTHGYPKLMNLLAGEPYSFASIFGMSAVLSLILAVFAEFVCSLLLIAGFLTRLAAVPLIGTMAVAAFYVHRDDPFSTKEKALLFLLIYIVLLLTGGGKFSIDYLILRKRRKSQRRYIR